MAEQILPSDVVAFWKEAGPDKWYSKDKAFDTDFRVRFKTAHWSAARGELGDWVGSAEGALALLILLDQYPRNSFRGTGHMYATDPLARMFCRQALDAGLDRQVAQELRLFFRNGQAWLVLLAGAIGFGGLFAVYSYIAPIVTDVGGLPGGAVPVFVLGFGLGMVVGTWLAGELAAWSVFGSLIASGIGSGLVLVVFWLAAPHGWALLPALGNQLIRTHPSFDARNFAGPGARLSTLVAAQPCRRTNPSAASKSAVRASPRGGDLGRERRGAGFIPDFKYRLVGM